MTRVFAEIENFKRLQVKSKIHNVPVRDLVFAYNCSNIQHRSRHAASVDLFVNILGSTSQPKRLKSC